MSLSPDKLAEMAEHQIKLQRKHRKSLDSRMVRARQNIHELVREFLAADPTITRIVLFGSLARDDVSSSNFDIDLAVSCSGEHFLRLVSIALNNAFTVDVVDLDRADERIKSAIVRDGITLYEK